MKTLRSLGGTPFGHDVLVALLKGYQRPNDKISDLLAKGAVLKLRRGLYVLGPDEHDKPLCLPLLANHILGPSYVSLEYALGWHGLIPEGVVDVTSVTLKRSRTMTTPVGRFSYAHLPQKAYAIGIRMEQTSDGGSFLLASAEKALCDLVMLTRGLPSMTPDTMSTWLLAHMRLDMEAIAAMDISIVRDCAGAGYKSRHLEVLAKTLESLR